MQIINTNKIKHKYKWMTMSLAKKDECEREGLNLGATPSGNKKHVVAKLK